MSIKNAGDKLLGRLFTRFPVLVDAWARSRKGVVNLDTPWTPLTKEPKDCRVALVTTAGVHLKSQAPYDMQDKEGDPSFREIPEDTPASDLMITHNYYDHSDADRNINVVMPLERLRELAVEEIIRAVAPRHFSFMGHILGRHINTLVAQTGPEVAQTLKRDGVDIAFLTPG